MAVLIGQIIKKSCSVIVNLFIFDITLGHVEESTNCEAKVHLGLSIKEAIVRF